MESLCGFKLDDCCTGAQVVQIVGPSLHHCLSSRQMGRAVVGPSVHIFDRMCQLMLDKVNPYFQNFVHDGSGCCPKAMGAVNLFRVSHPAQGGIDGVFAHGAFPRSKAWENICMVLLKK